MTGSSYPVVNWQQHRTAMIHYLECYALGKDIQGLLGKVGKEGVHIFGSQKMPLPEGAPTSIDRITIDQFPYKHKTPTLSCGHHQYFKVLRGCATLQAEASHSKGELLHRTILTSQWAAITADSLYALNFDEGAGVLLRAYTSAKPQLG